MAQISGIPVENITNMYGIDAATIVSIGGIPTTSIPGWPSGGPTCTDSVFSYGEAPGIACGADAEFYSFDENNSLLYLFGYCNDENYYAPEGFYVDNSRSIFWWHLDRRVWVWEAIGEC
jgi:hypothetical protein